jgi:acylphosphatase
MTLQIAKEFDVSGYVRNLPDGRVELEAEGDRSQVAGFVEEVLDRLDAYIRKTERAEGTRAARHRGFRIA